MPTVAAVQGHCFAAGAMLSLCHDWRVMRADRGYWCLPEVDISIPFTVGMGALIQAKLPPAAATEAMTTGHRFGGPHAVQSGIVQAAVAEAEVLAAALAKVRPLTGKAGPTLGTIKERMYAGVVATPGLIRAGPCREPLPADDADLQRTDPQHQPAVDLDARQRPPQRRDSQLERRGGRPQRRRRQRAGGSPCGGARGRRRRRGGGEVGLRGRTADRSSGHLRAVGGQDLVGEVTVGRRDAAVRRGEHHGPLGQRGARHAARQRHPGGRARGRSVAARASTTSRAALPPASQRLQATPISSAEVFSKSRCWARNACTRTAPRADPGSLVNTVRTVSAAQTAASVRLPRSPWVSITTWS